MEDNINGISFEDFPFKDILSEQDKNLELLNKFNYLEDSTYKNLLKTSQNKIIKFITYKKTNKTSFIISKKIKRKEIKNNNYSNGRWTKEERIKFAYGLYKYGPNWNIIRQFIGTRDNIQINSHAQKFLIKIKTSKNLIEKGLNFEKSTWKKCYKILKKNLSDKTLLSFLMSIESELEDNKRMTNRYIEKKELMNKTSQKQITLEQNNTFLTTSDEKTDILKEKEPEIFDVEKNNINLNENDFLEDINFNQYENLCFNDYQKSIYNKKIEKDYILLDNYLTNINIDPYNIYNYLDFS